MPNPTDQERLSDTQRGGVVVNLDEYRAQAGTRPTATPMIPDALKSSLSLIAIGVLFLLLCFGFIRRG